MRFTIDDLQNVNTALDLYLKAKTIPSLMFLLEEPITYSIEKTEVMSAVHADCTIHASKTDIMSAVYVKCSGDLHIGALWYISEKELKPLARRLLGKSETNEFDNLASSSISEIGNILTASIANAIHDEKGCRIMTSVPGYANESLCTLLEYVAADFADQSESLVASSVKFCGLNSGIKLQMFLIQDPVELKRLVA